MSSTEFADEFFHDLGMRIEASDLERARSHFDQHVIEDGYEEAWRCMAKKMLQLNDLMLVFHRDLMHAMAGQQPRGFL